MRTKKWLIGLGIITGIVCCVPHIVKATVSNTVVQTTTAYGDGSNVDFTPTFDFRSNSWLTVTMYDTSTSPATVTQIPQSAGSGGFQVSGGNPGTTIVMGTAPTTTQYLVIGRSIPLTQPVVFNPASIFPYQGISSQLDQVTLTLQNLAAAEGDGGGASAPGGSSGSLPSPGAPYDFIAWNSAGASTINATVQYDSGQTTFQTGDIEQFNGSGWATYLLTQTNLMQTLNGSPNTPLSAASGGSGITNSGAFTWGSNPITFTTTGTTNLTLPTSGTLITGTATNNNTVSTIVKRDASGNFSAGTVTANLTGNVTGNLTGNVTGNASGTAANLTGILALGNGGTGQTTQQSAINALLGVASQPSGDFARFDGTNVSLAPIGITDIPTGFARSKLAAGTANTLLMDDASGNITSLVGGTTGYCAVFNGTTWTSATCGGGTQGPLVGTTYYGTDSGTANAYVVATTSNPGSLVTGLVVTFSAVHANTGTSTLNLDSLGATALKKPSASGLVNLGSGDIVANQLVQATYDGTEFVITNQLATSAGTVTSVAVSVPTGLTISSGSPVTSSGTIAIGWSGTIPNAQMPSPTATSLGGIESLASTSHEWINAISTSGVPSATQPAFTDISGSVASGQMPAYTGDATSSAGATALTLATVNSNVGTFGSGTAIPQVTVNGKGLVTAVTTVAPTFTAPTPQNLTSQGTQAGLLFNISAPGSNVAAGCTYTNNSNTYTVLVPITTSNSGWILAASGTGSTSGTTLSKSTCAGGPSTITFSATQTLSTYTPTTSALYTEVEGVGAGGGGSGSGGSAGGTAGTASAFIIGANMVVLNGGGGGLTGANTGGGAGGGSVVIGSVTGALTFTGAGGNGATTSGSALYTVGGMGGVGYFAGAGAGNTGGGNGAAAVGGTGSGGGGAGSTTAAAAGGGGGAGAYGRFQINSPGSSTIYWTIGVGGSGGSGTDSGGTGAAGSWLARDKFQ